MYAGVPTTVPSAVSRRSMVEVVDGGPFGFIRASIEGDEESTFSRGARARPKSVTRGTTILADEDVCRLEVAVHEPRLVGRGQALSRGDEDREDLGDVVITVEPPAQVSARHELHRDEHLAVLTAPMS